MARFWRIRGKIWQIECDEELKNGDVVEVLERRRLETEGEKT